MEEKIKVLILEDLPSDAELAEREVKAVLKNYTAVVTDTEQGFIKALENFKPDLIISDYMLPAFNGMKALQITREQKRFIPFIILTGSMNEETAVECLKAGADDYVIKEHIKRLGIAILNALDKKKKRQERERAEEEVQKAKANWENIFQAVGHPVIIIDKEHNIISANNAAQEVTGLSEKELKGKKCYEIFHNTNEPPKGCPAEKLLKTGKIEREEMGLEVLGRVALVSTTPVFDEKGKIEKIIHIVTDITERKQAEEKLKESEKRFRDLVEMLPEAVLEADENLNFTYVNQRALEMSGYSEEDVKNGLNGFDLLTEKSRVDAKEYFRMRLEGKNPDSVEYFARKKDGTIYPILFNANTIIFDGKVTGIRGLIIDITKRKQAEEMLQLSHERLTDAQKITKIGNWEANLVTGELYWSQTIFDIFGFDSKFFKPSVEAFYESVHQDDRDIVFESEKLSEQTGLHDVEHRIIRPDGEVRFVHELAKRFKDDSGNLIMLRGTVQDITERKQASDQIQQNLKEKTALIQEIYHRTKNNMAMVKAMLSVESRRSDNDFVKSTFREVSNKIQAMSLVHQKLYQAQDLSNINLNDYIEDLTKLIMYSYGVLAEKVETKLEMHDFRISIDFAVPLGLIINELITNVFKHAFPNRQEGVISIRLFRERDKTINLEIADNGRGFPPNFDPRKDSSMGLATVFSVAEGQLKGEISVESENGLKWHIKFKDNLYEERV